MEYDILPMSLERRVTLCGTNVNPTPVIYEDRVMEEHSLLYVIDGECEIGQDGKAYHLERGDMMLMRAGSRHYGITPCSANMRSMFIHFNTLVNDQGPVKLSPMEVRSYAEGSTVCLPTVTRCGSNNSISVIIRNIVNIFWWNRDDCVRTLTLNINCLLSELAYIARNSLDQSEEWITLLLQEMRMNQSHFISLEEAAEMSHMSVRTMSAKFKQIMGKTLHEYQLSIKLQMAYHALCTGRYSVKEVAQTFGFCDPYYFSRTFKKTYGRSPSEVRNNPPGEGIHRTGDR